MFIRSTFFVWCSVTICFSQLNSQCSKSNSWAAMPKMPGQTGECAAGIINNAMYVAGEADTNTYKFDFGNNSWSKVAYRLYAGNHHASVIIRNKLWLIGGIDNGAYGKVQVFDPATNKWEEKAPLPWDGGSVCAAYINNVIYACGGIVGFNGGQHRGGTETTNRCAYYNISTDYRWHEIEPMPQGRNHAAVETDGRRMWIFGGRIGKNVPSNGYNTVQVYDTVTRKWTTSDDSKLAPLPQARGGTGHAVFHNGKFYVFGGETENGAGATSNYVYNRVDIYDVSKKSWSRGENMPTPRHGIFPVYHDNAIHIASGGLHHGYSVTDTYDKYCL